jgi:starch synthase
MANHANLRLLYIASEAAGFAKTGGLADVAGSLPRALAEQGIDCALMLPCYRSARQGLSQSDAGPEIRVPVGRELVNGRIRHTKLPDSNVRVYLIEHPGYFERDDPPSGRGIYQLTRSDGSKEDYEDNCQRFVFFARAAIEALAALNFWPDIIHANDWQTGLVPVFLREAYGQKPPYDHIRTLFSIHNIAYQGLFPASAWPLTGLDWRLFNAGQLEYYGQLSFLKAGIVFSDWLTTVSPTYAREIQTPQLGYGLDGVLRERSARLIGIVNGVDVRVWDPAIDEHIPCRYDAQSFVVGKARCKAVLQERCGLPSSPPAPLAGMVARLVRQKGIDLLIETLPAIVQRGIQLIVLGQGEPQFERALLDLARRFPQQVAVTIDFDEALAHQIEAAADIFLMPSQYEPSGLNQLYSLKYGTVPVVHAVGGLVDTIVDCTDESLAAGKATGFVFKDFTPQDLLVALDHALSLYRSRPSSWRQLVLTGMLQDWSWQRSALSYHELYDRVRTSAPPAP